MIDADAPAAESSSPSTDRDRVRTRRVVVLTGLLTVLVMAGVIALGLASGRRDGHPVAPGFHPDGSIADVYGPEAGRSAFETMEGCTVDPEHPPRVVFDLPPTGLDFGEVKQGVEIDQEVTFRNEGSGPLCIRRVETGCGCIKATLSSDQRKFEPGEAGSVRVTLNTKGREGQQKKTVTLYTNALDVPLQKFLVKAEISLGLRASHSFVNFGRVTAGRPAESVIRFRSAKAQQDWTITEVRGSQELDGALVDYRWRVEEIEDPKDRVVDLHLEHPGMSRSGTAFQDVITVKTTHPDRPEYELRAYLLVVDPILPLPQRVVLGYVPGATTSRIKLVKGDEDVAFRVTGVGFETPDGAPLAEGEAGFTAEFGQEESGEWWVEVGYDGSRSRPAGPLRAVLVVTTDLDRMPEVRVECFATVQ